MPTNAAAFIAQRGCMCVYVCVCVSGVFILALHTLVASLDIIVVDRIKKLYVDNVLSE